jgi:epoxyqueuosine reductase QueG
VEIARFVRESDANRFTSGQPYFDEPLVGFASAEDPLFEAYKEIIGSFHLTPRELFEDAFGPGSFAGGTVVSWILPITAETRLSNRLEERGPSERWARTRDGGERFNGLLRRHVVDLLDARGYRTLAPWMSPLAKTLVTSPVGRASTWSERHAAYAAGLGTFSLTDALITAKGTAHRVGSVLTELVLPPSERTYEDHRANCLFYQGSCGACIERCPAGALSEQGHDKVRCKEYMKGLEEELGTKWQIAQETGCGLCQTGVPCESRIPARAKATRGR